MTALGRVRVGLGLALVLGVGVGCGGDGEARAAAPVPGNPSPEWEGRTLDGEPISLSGLEGEVVVLNVWATWCAPCLREMPALERLHARFADEGLRVVGVSIDRASAAGAVRSFVDDLELSFTIALDPDQSVMSRFRTIGVPETFLIDHEGVIAYRWIGEFDPMAPSEIERIEPLLERRAEAREGAS